MPTYTVVSASEKAPNAAFDEDLLSKIDLNTQAWAADDPSVPFQPLRAHPHLLDQGEGSVDATFSSTQTIARGLYNVSTFTVTAGTVLTCHGEQIIIRAKTAIQIDGTLICQRPYVNPTVGTPAGSQAANSMLMGGSGGGGGGKDAAGATGRSGGVTFGLAAGAGGPSSTNGGNGNPRPAVGSNPIGAQVMLSMGFISWYGGGYGGNGQDEGAGGGLGGRGGGVIILIAPTINITGTVSADGENGVTTNSGHGGGGGGGGGAIIAVSEATMFAGGGTITANGGTGGVASTGGNGGNGGNGSIIDLVI